jgi:hypothetical protein
MGITNAWDVLLTTSKRDENVDRVQEPVLKKRKNTIREVANSLLGLWILKDSVNTRRIAVVGRFNNNNNNTPTNCSWVVTRWR